MLPTCCQKDLLALCCLQRQLGTATLPRQTSLVGRRRGKKEIQGRTPFHYAAESSRAPAIWKHLRDLESSSRLSITQFNITRLQRGWANHGLGFSLVLNIIGILALIFMMLLGTPD